MTAAPIPLSSLAGLKRFLATGPTLTLVTFQRSGVDVPNANLGVARRVVEANTVGFALAVMDGGPASYLNWPKAAELTFIGDRGDVVGFRIDLGTLRMTYMFGAI
jgi:hypothetical protein